MTRSELESRKEKAIALLNTHSDKYRLLYVDIVNIKEPTQQDLQRIRIKRDMLALEEESIQKQISMITQLEYYLPKEEQSKEEQPAESNE